MEVVFRFRWVFRELGEMLKQKEKKSTRQQYDRHQATKTNSRT